MPEGRRLYMPLRLADLNKEYEIMRIGGSAEVKHHVGAKVIVVSRSGEGMIVSIKGSRIAVGKDMANKIYLSAG